MEAVLITPFTSAGTATAALTLTATAASAGHKPAVAYALASAETAFGWALKVNGTTILQGDGLADADAGITIGGSKFIEAAAGGTVSLVVTPETGTTACTANLGIYYTEDAQ